MKKGIIGLIVIIAIFGTMLGLICANARYIFTSQKFYTEAQLKEEYNKGYESGLEVHSDENLFKRIEELSLINAELKLKIDALNKQIADLQSKNESNLELIEQLKKEKADLEANVAYYDNYLKNMETDDVVFATFYVDGKIFNIQKVVKNGFAGLETQPEDTERYKFNGWTVDGVKVNLDSYRLTASTTFVADLLDSWETVYTGDFDILTSKKLTISGLSAGDIVRITISKICIYYDVDGNNLYYLKKPDGSTLWAEHWGTAKDYDFASLIITTSNNQIIAEEVTFTLNFNCTENTLNFEGFSASDNESSINELVISKVEVFR